MASDITELVKSTQTVVDNVTTVLQTIKNLKDQYSNNLNLIDTKISNHNTDANAHAYLQRQISDLYVVVDEPQVTGPTSITSGTSATWTILANPSVAGATIDDYSIMIGENEYLISKESDGSGVFSYTFTQEADATSVTFTVRARGTWNGNRVYSPSKLVTANFDTDKPLDISTIQVYFNDVLIQGQSLSVPVSGMGNQSGFSHYEMTCDDENLVLSNNTNIAEGQQATISVPSDHWGEGNTLVTFTVSAVDTAGRKYSVSRTSRLNAKPTVAMYTTTLPGYVFPGQSIAFVIDNVSDPDNDSIDLNIFSMSDEFTITTSSPLSVGQVINATVSSNAQPGQNIYIGLQAYDRFGASSGQVTITLPIRES